MIEYTALGRDQFPYENNQRFEKREDITELLSKIKK